MIYLCDNYHQAKSSSLLAPIGEHDSGIISTRIFIGDKIGDAFISTIAMFNDGAASIAVQLNFTIDISDLTRGDAVSNEAASALMPFRQPSP